MDLNTFTTEGIHTYYVHIRNANAIWEESKAHVAVYINNELTHEFDVLDMSACSNDTDWYVFTYDAATGTIMPVVNEKNVLSVKSTYGLDAKKYLNHRFIYSFYC